MSTNTLQERRVAAGQCPVCARRLNRKGECPAAPHDWTGKRPAERPRMPIEFTNLQGDTWVLDGPEEPA